MDQLNFNGSSEAIEKVDSMSEEVDDEVKGEGGNSEKQKPQTSTKTVVSIDQTEFELSECHKDNDNKKEKERAFRAKNDDTLSSVRLLGEPLVKHGPYTFYSALGYRKRGDVPNSKRQRRKKQQSTESCCCSNVDADNYSCSCSVSSSGSEWSVVRMNHFYAIRPWFNIRNNSDSLQFSRERRRPSKHLKHSSKLSSSTAAAERSVHQYQQSVYIGELELLWRDDSIETTNSVPSSSLLKKRISNRLVPSSSITTSNGGEDKINAITINRHGDVAATSEDDDGVGNDDNSALLLPRRRTLPRRTRQPSAKKLEAAESCAAVVASVVSGNHSLQQSLNHRSRQSTVPLSKPPSMTTSQSTPDAQYKHGNLLCSVRFYVMPDQMVAGRIGGVYGEDEVLEINTLNANGGADRHRWPGNEFLNGGSKIGSILNGSGVDDYSYGSGSNSSGTLPFGCSGFVLRVEDFVEWVRGGLWNYDDDVEDTESDNESLESESGDDQKPIKTDIPKEENDQVSKLPTLVSDVKSKVKQLDVVLDDKTNVKLESNFTADEIKKDEIAAVIDQSDNLRTSVKETHDDNYYLNLAVDEAVNAERFPLAAAKIHKKECGTINHHHDHHCCSLNCDSLVNGDITTEAKVKHDHLDHKHMVEASEVDDKHGINQKAHCKHHNRGSQSNDKNKKNCSGGINKQKVVVMSYSRYCRYRAQLQRRREEQFSRNYIISKDGTEKKAITYQGANIKTKTRVLFCRETYDFPAERLLHPFCELPDHNQNATVLVNHMAPKLKGWPTYPASWMSFRWNRVRRQLRHLERDNGDNEDQRRRRRRRKLKKTCRQRQNGTSGAAINYSSSTEDDYLDDSDSEDASSASNDAATNSTTFSSTSTSDSDGAPLPSVAMPKTINKNHSSSKVNGGVHSDKKILSLPSSSSMIIINGATTVTTVANNKRNATATGQSGLQQLTKRRRVIYTTESITQQNHQQRVLYQQQSQQPQPRQQNSNFRPRQSEQFHQLSQSQRQQHTLVIKQQQPKLHSFNRRLPIPIASIQPSTTRIIHHHLPPSVTIMPVVVPTSNTTSQNHQRFNNRLQNRQKQHSTSTILSAASQRRYNSERQPTSLPPVIEYDNDDNHEYASEDNGRYKKSTIAAAIAACNRRVEQHDFEDKIKQQREEEERQRRWLVDALRLGGLEVTAVPLNTSSGNNSGSGNNIKISSSVTETQQQKQWRTRGVSFQSLLSTDNEHNKSDIQHHGVDGDDDSIQESDTESVVMTVTPDVVCILNKSQQQESEETKQQQMSSRDVLTSTASVTMTHHQQQLRHSINSNIDNNSGSDQQQHPTGVTTAAVAAAALHDKINRAIDSLKQQQQQKPNTTTPVSNIRDNVIVMGSTNHHHPNSSNNNKQQQKQYKNSRLTGVRQQQTTPSLLDLSVKPQSMSNITKRQQKLLPSPTITNNSFKQLQQQRKSQSPFHSVSMTGTSTTPPNLEITIVPVTTSSTTSSTKPSQQQKRSLSATETYNSISGTEIQSSASLSFPKTIRQQSQRRNATTTSSTTVSASVLDLLCGGRNRNLQQQRNGRGVSVTTTSSSQQQQTLEIATSAATTIPSQHQNDKRKLQQNKKD